MQLPNEWHHAFLPLPLLSKQTSWSLEIRMTFAFFYSSLHANTQNSNSNVGITYAKYIYG